MYFLRKIRKNKFVVLAICVIVVSLVYSGIQKAIDNYSFKKNNDITSEDESIIDEKIKDNTQSDSRIKFDAEEIDLEIEENESGDEFSEENEQDEDSGVERSDLENAEMVGDSEDKEVDLSKNSTKIYVYITGEVNVPGVVILNEGSRIVDAINSAGGTTAKANISKVNLVYVLEDGMKVNIPNDSDLKNNPNFEYITLNSGDGGRDDYNSVDSSNNSEVTSSSSSSNSKNEKKYSVVNINTATQTELETLPGIGPSLALKIINYRKANGKFSSIDEIKQVSGIGESKFEKIKKYITI